VREAICNTSPLLYLYRLGCLEWVPELFDSVWVPKAVVSELRKGQKRGYDVPAVTDFPWAEIVQPVSVPSEWLALDLGPGELHAMALGLENPARVLLLDDALARRLAHAAGLPVWGTLRVLLEAKDRGLTPSVGPLVDRLQAAGMWVSADIRQRVLTLADEPG